MSGVFSLGKLATINLLEYLESVVKVCALARPSLSQLKDLQLLSYDVLDWLSC